MAAKLKKSKKYVHNNKNKFAYIAALSALAVAAVFITAYIFILPTVALEVASSVTNFWVYYSDNDQWVNIDESKTVPGNAKLQLTVQYENVNISELKEADYTLEFTVPDLLKEPHAEGDLMDSENNKIGTVSCVDNKVNIVFSQDWIAEQEKNNIEKINKGEFYVTGDVNLSALDDEYKCVVKINDTEKTIQFDNESIVKYGELYIKKSEAEFISDESGDYLEYELTVLTGKNAMTDVKVQDNFISYIVTNNNKEVTYNSADYIEKYVGVTTGEAEIIGTDSSVAPVEAGEPQVTQHGTVKLDDSQSASPGTLVWNIGNMAANSSRTLTYRVKINESYINSCSTNTIKNSAEVFSKEYSHGSAESDFTPTVLATMTKAIDADRTVENDDGTFTVYYRIVVGANKNNTYILRNIKMIDFLKDSSNNLTGNNDYSEIWQEYADFNPDSFHLYDGNVTVAQIESGSVAELDGWQSYNSSGSNPAIDTNDSTYGNSARIYLGDFTPGQYKTLVYTLTVSKDYFENNTGGSETLGNRALVVSAANEAKRLSMYSTSTTITNKSWARKVAGEQLETQIEVELGADEQVYEYENGSIVEADNNPQGFDVSSGSFKYEIIVNETGEFDVSQAVMSDRIDANYLAYSGYLRVDAYAIDSDNLPSGSTDSEVVESVKQVGEKTKTVWLNIDDLSTFSLKFKDLGFESGNSAYLLTYYASPVDSFDMDVHANNSFAVTGAVGKGGTYYDVNASVDVSVTVLSDNTINISKKGWYYAPSRSAELNWQNNSGGAFWVIEIDANTVPTTLLLQDELPSGTPLAALEGVNTQYNQIYGVYKGKLPSGTAITDYPNVTEFYNSELVTSGQLTSLEKTEYLNLERKSNVKFNITFNKEIKLNKARGEKLYIIVGLKTSASNVPQPNSLKAYTNKIYSGIVGNETNLNLEDTATVFGDVNNGVYKNTYAAYSYDGEEMNCFNSAAGTTVRQENNAATAYNHMLYSGHQESVAGTLTDNTNGASEPVITEAGTYIEWVVKIDYTNNINGLAQMSDMLPDGLELAYVRYFSNGSGYGDTLPQSADIAELENDPDWTKYTLNAPLDIKAAPQYDTIYYYNRSTGEVRWAVDGLQKDTQNASGAKSLGAYQVEYQIVCKITDEDVLLNGAEKDFNNSVAVTAGNFAESVTDSDSIALSVSTVEKTGETDGGSDKYSFTITLNPLNEDLMPGDTVTLVDEMSSTLTLDADSIKITDSEGTEVTGWNSAVTEGKDGGQILTISALPDETQLIITYDTAVKAAPGQVVNISNDAHWSGYSTPAAAAFAETGFHYSAGGTVDTDNFKPYITLSKVDGLNTSKALAGAEFKLEKMQTTLSDDPYSVTYSEPATVVAEGLTTDESGVLTYGKDASDDKKLTENTVYRLTETTPPDGYQLSEKVYYFAVTRGKKDSSNTTVFPEFPDEVAVQYSGAEYTLTVYNYKGELMLDKQFVNYNGDTVTPLDADYKFGLYNTANPASDSTPLQTLTITCQQGKDNIYSLDGVVQTEPKFTNIDCGETYYVFELDSNGSPIADGADYSPADSDNLFFTVSYGNNKDIQISNNQKTDGVPTVTVTNKIFYTTDLPIVGGAGIGFYLITGAALILAAAVMYMIYRNKIKRRIR